LLVVDLAFDLFKELRAFAVIEEFG